jgi:flagellar hook-basal body complex protein FliE
MDVKALNAALAYARATASKPQGAVAIGEIGDASGASQSFAKLVQSSLGDMAKATAASEAQALKAVTGKADITEIVAAVSNAEMALETVVAVRDRVISAYQDIIKMPI